MTHIDRPHIGRRMALASGAAALLNLHTTRAHAAMQVGSALPFSTITTATGPRPLIDGKAKLTYVDFWASWCGPCRQSFPWMNALHTKHGPQGLQIVAINVDAKRSDADTFLAKHPASFLIAFDPQGALAKAADVKTMPTSALLDAKGRVLLVHHGFLDKDREPLEAQIVAALRPANS